MAFDESKVKRDDQGQFAEKAGGNAAFLAKFSKKIGATDDPATAKAKLAAATKKTAPMKVAGPPTLPRKRTPAKKTAPAKVREFKTIDATRAAALQQRMLKDEPWTPAQRAALRTYTGDDYVKINAALRKGGGTAKTKATAGDARQGMREVPEDVMVYRGMGSGTAFGFVRNKPVTPAMIETLVGRSFHDPGFGSTAIREGGYGFRQRIRARISVPAGTRGAFVEGITKNAGEDEFVLDASTHYRITGYEVTGEGQYTLNMEVVSQDD